MSGAQPGQILVGRYRLDERVPSDLTHVEAWSARDIALDRLVRISLLTGPHTSEAMDATRRAALVADPRLPKVFDVGSEEGRDYVVGEPYAGQSLAEVVSQGIVDPQQARALIGEAAAALEIAADRGVHHRALRPESIRVDGSRVLVTGLGLDAGMAGIGPVDAEHAARADASGLVALLYYAMTARWAGPSLDVDWIDAHAVHPLAVQRTDGVVERLDAARQDAPKDLAELCAVSLAGSSGDAHEWGHTPGDAPASPGAVVGKLRPWGDVSVVAALPEFVPTEPARVTRQSVRSAFSEDTERPPGTPPPARPVRPSLAGAPLAGVPLAAASSAATSAPAAVPGTTAGGAPPTDPFPANGASPFPSGPPETPARKVDPTRATVFVVVALVAVALVWSAANLLGGFGPIFSWNGRSPEPAATTAAANGETPKPTQTPTTQEVRPRIASGEVVDPQNVAKGQQVADHPESAASAYDTDQGTVWKSNEYKTATFGGLKSGFGYAITLEEAAPVSSIVLMTDCTGGNVQVRATSADNPTGGTVLASGAFVPGSTELTLDKPVTAKTFVLWFDSLPTAPNTSFGKYRVDIAEIVLS